MARINVNGAAIVDWDSFHDEFQRAFRFFDGYGRNGDAWIDCMTDYANERYAHMGERVRITVIQM